MARLHAAAATVDITPPPGTWMTGFANRVKPSRGVRDPLLARGLLLQSGAARLAAVSCDLLGLSPVVRGAPDILVREAVSLARKIAL